MEGGEKKRNRVKKKEEKVKCERGDKRMKGRR
jgi:hypothetical protein